jgi:hypothetical protein
VLVNGSVEEVGDGGEEFGEVSDDSRFDFVDVACFVAVDFFHLVGHLFFGDVSEFEWWWFWRRQWW